jgi:glycosyltransferase involved in cell wall biosynthesis
MVKPTLAIVSLWDAASRNAESGYAYSMRAQLHKYFEIADIFPLPLPGEALTYPVRAAYKAMGRYYHPMREPIILKALARRIEKHLRGIHPQALFAPSSIPLSFVETSKPRIFATDQPFGDFVETYLPTPARRFVRLGHAQEKRALTLAARASYPSQWAADNAIRRYDGDRERIDVIPWGANLPGEISQERVDAAIASRPANRCDLVFIGRHWLRKGGDALIATVEELNRRGLPTRATIIGCSPPGLPAHHFDVHPFLDKGQADHFALLSDIMSRSHFLFLPSRAEAYGQAFCEAAAFGLPSIGSTAGGIPTIIRDGETGFVRPTETSAQDFASLIQETLADQHRYGRMARLAREDFRDRLNWDSFGKRLGETIMTVV